MIKKRTSYLIVLLVSLLTSCSSSILDEDLIMAQDKVGITFTLSTNSIATVSRSLTQRNLSQYENTIDPDNFRVLAYGTDGQILEVTIFYMEKTTDNTYKISGELKGNHQVEKVMILANCDKSFDPFTTSLDKLTYHYTGDDFNPNNPKSYIPMWGVKRITSPLQQGKTTDIGTINLLRAMAKIKVDLSDVSIGCELIQVKMTRYNKQGACVPRLFDSVDKTTDVTETTIPTGVGVGSDMPFYKMDDNSYVLYLPEYKNENNQDLVRMSILVRDVNGVTYEKNIIFGKYSSSGFFANEHWNILRNHYYTFNLIMQVAADGNLNLGVKSEKYAEFVLKPTYGN